MRRHAAVAALAVMIGLAGCTGTGAGTEPSSTAVSDSEPRVVTTAESELLAVIRFKNFDAGTRSVTAAFDDAGGALTLDGWFDYETHVGYGLVTVDGESSDLILWDATTLAALGVTRTSTPPLPVPAATEAWTPAAVDPTASAAQAVLGVIANLGADRPENPLLLRQNGALHIADDDIDGTPVSIFTGPAVGAVSADGVDPDAAGLRYWVDDTGLLLRVEARLGSSWVTVDFGPADDVSISGPIPSKVPGT